MKNILIIIFTGILFLPSAVYAIHDIIYDDMGSGTGHSGSWKGIIWNVALFIIIIVCVYISTIIKRRKERARTIWNYWVLVHNTNTFFCKVDSVRRNKNEITVNVSKCWYEGAVLEMHTWFGGGIKRICWNEDMDRFDIFLRKKTRIKKGEYIVVWGDTLEKYMKQIIERIRTLKGEYPGPILRIDNYEEIMEILPKDTERVYENVEKFFEKAEYLFGGDVAETLRLIAYFDNDEKHEAFCQVKKYSKNRRQHETQKREFFDELKKLRETGTPGLYNII